MLIANWRDTLHPDSGGSERYVERIASGLAERGYEVSVLCPRHANAGRTDVIDGVRYIRRGGVFTVYLWALLAVAWQRPDVVIDVQNGMPFLSPAGGPLARWSCSCTTCTGCSGARTSGGRIGRIGWWLESWLAPRVYRRCRYVTVSEHTRDGTGRARRRPGPHQRGAQRPRPGSARHGRPGGPEPLLVAVSRLVPHKQIEHAIETVARLRRPLADLRLEIVGRGPWHEPLVELRRRTRRRRPGHLPGLGRRAATSTRSSPGRGCTCARRSRRAGASW